MSNHKKVNNFDEFINECCSANMQTEPGQQFPGTENPAGCLPPASMLHTVLAIQTTLRLAHWQTTSFAQHEAFGKIYAEIDQLGDQLAEVYMGKYGNSQVAPGTAIGLQNATAEEMPIMADVCLVLLNTATTQLLTAEDTEINNIADEIRAQLQKLKYLFTLK